MLGYLSSFLFNIEDGFTTTNVWSLLPSSDGLAEWPFHPLITNRTRYLERCNGNHWNRLFERLKQHQSQMQATHQGKAIVWRCAGAGCGGLGDRIRGAPSNFFLALLTNRAYFIDHTFPVELSDYFDYADDSISWKYNRCL
jgi:hypothetical protein